MPFECLYRDCNVVLWPLRIDLLVSYEYMARTRWPHQYSLLCSSVLRTYSPTWPVWAAYAVFSQNKLNFIRHFMHFIFIHSFIMMNLQYFTSKKKVSHTSLGVEMQPTSSISPSQSRPLELLRLTAPSAKKFSSALFKEFIKVFRSHWLSYSALTISRNFIKILVYFKLLTIVD